MSVFILEKICKSFATNKVENKVLTNISFEFPEKGLFSIVGKSGCGKSTLLNILMGIEKPTAGKVYFNGQDISKLNDKEFSGFHLDGVSLIFQHYNLFNDLTAIENVLLPLEMSSKNSKESKEKAEALFKRFNIEHLIKRKVKNLSGGEKQRIAILRSLITDPVALLCDEPTGALDSKNSVEIMEILREISKNKLVIMVSHNMDLVRKYSDKILILRDGVLDNNSSQKIPTQVAKNNFKKIRYSSSWISKFIKRNLKKDFKKNLFSLIACTLSFAAMFLSVGFSAGSSSSQEKALKQNLSLGFASASESNFIDIEGSPLSFEKTVKPDVELIDQYFGDFESIVYDENISYFISNYPSCYFEKEKINDFELIPVYDITLNSYGKEMLNRGRAATGDFEEIIVNEEFNQLLGGNSLNKVIIISNEAPVNYVTGDQETPIVKDTLSFTKKFKIVGIIKEFSFLNTPKIYYSYPGAKHYLQNEVMENVSFYLHKRTTFFDYLQNCKNDDPISSYSCYLFIKDISEIDNFFSRVSSLKDETIQITSKALTTKETYSTFISSFSGTLIVFVIIAFIGINFILGMISLSTFLENRKTTAILTCLGARNSSIYNIHLFENYLVVFLSFILSIFLSIFLQSKLNVILCEKFTLENLISIPIKSYYNLPYGLILLLLSVAIICSTIFTLIPMFIYRHNSITDELRDE